MIHQLEALEERRLFAKLTLTATPHSDTVALDIKNTRIWYTLNGVTQKLRSSGIGVVVLSLGNGNDKLILGANAPAIYVDCGTGNDTVAGAAGTNPETLLGGNGDDSLIGGQSADRIDAGFGNDALNGGPGQDTLLGGNGNDTIRANDGESDSVDGGADTDTAYIDINDPFDNVEIRHYVQ